VALRLGHKTNNYGEHTAFTHWAADAGVKIEVMRQVALDISARYRDAATSSVNYQSTRYHAAVLYELNPANTVGIRYTTSTSTNRAEEERNGWRVNYQHNF
jgi:opacity protein-like surface antigen